MKTVFSIFILCMNAQSDNRMQSKEAFANVSDYALLIANEMDLPLDDNASLIYSTKPNLANSHNISQETHYNDELDHSVENEKHAFLKTALKPAETIATQAADISNIALELMLYSAINESNKVNSQLTVSELDRNELKTVAQNSSLDEEEVKLYIQNDMLNELFKRINLADANQVETKAKLLSENLNTKPGCYYVTNNAFETFINVIQKHDCNIDTNVKIKQNLTIGNTKFSSNQFEIDTNVDNCIRLNDFIQQHVSNLESVTNDTIPDYALSIICLKKNKDDSSKISLRKTQRGIYVHTDGFRFYSGNNIPIETKFESTEEDGNSNINKGGSRYKEFSNHSNKILASGNGHTSFNLSYAIYAIAILFIFNVVRF